MSIRSRRNGGWLFLIICLPALAFASTAWADDGDEVLAQARKAWTDKDYAKAAELYQKLRDEFPRHAFVKAGDAQFWVWACVGNAGEKQKEIAEIQRFLKEYPEHKSRGYALFFLGTAYRQIGDEEKAKAAWNELLEKYPNDSMVPHARAALEGGSGDAAAGKGDSGAGKGDSAAAAARRASLKTLGSDFIDDARGAAAWLEAVGVKDGEDGLVWPQYGDSKAHAVDFYDGSSGVCLYFLNMYRVTGEEKYAELAKKAARSIASRAVKGKSGLCWKNEDEENDRVVTQEPSPGLYTGTAGIGYVFLCLHREFHDEEYLDTARGAADWILATAKRDGDLLQWNDDTDIIAGAAGTGLFLLEIAEATGEAKYRDAAEGAARWLLSVAVKTDDGIKWKSTASLDRFYTGFSHGTAGNAYFLARVYESTKKEEYLQAAKSAAGLLRKIAVKDGKGLKWYHYEPDHLDRFQTGWCHGPAGTGRLFLKLYQITGEKRYLTTARKGAAWLMKSLDPTKEGTVFYGLSMCCGAAGVGDFFIDLYLATGDEAYLTYAGRVGEYLMRQGKPDGAGAKWTNYDAPDEKGVIHYGTGHMIGAAGVGTFLLRLHAVCSYLDGHVVTFADKPHYPSARDRDRPSKGYLILTNLPKTDPYYRAATKLAEAHDGQIRPIDLQHPLAIRRGLASLQPRYVALVLKPEDIDSNLQREMIALSTRMDDDPFCDFAFGFITGATADDAVGLVDRSLRVQKEGLRKKIVETAVTSGVKSYTIEGQPSRELPDFTEDHVYWSCVEADPNVLNFVKEHLKKLSGNGVVVFSGCGDPEAIWLFADQRNMARDKHWPFDPKKVGDDPKGEMPRIFAGQLRGIDLGGAVVWSGTCHSGVLHRAFIEGDIVSTFGRVDNVTEYTIPEGRSLGLTILGDGPSAFLGPIGANHGFACNVEMERAAITGWPLGDIMRSRYNEIILAAGNRLDIESYEVGKPESREDPMRGGGANRTLFGDPLFAPFPGTGKEPIEKLVRPKVEPMAKGGGLTVRCKVVDGNSSMFWDMFGSDRQGPGRIYTTVELPVGAGEVGEVTATAKSASGEAITITKCRWGVERIDGKRICHLQANADKDAISAVGTVVEFKVGWKRTEAKG